jgi:D-arginine dehydrogenase
MATQTADVIVLGAGMAGASMAAELAPHVGLLLIEVEDQPGRHATGRSAAMYFESYGNPTVRALTRASRAFLERPPDGFAEVPLLRRRDALLIADATHQHQLDARLAAPDTPACLRRIEVVAALARVPILRAERLAGALLDSSGHDIDVAALHQGFLRQARRHGARLVLGAGETALGRANGVWRVATRVGVFEAPLLVNASGAWADEVARAAGARPVGLQPMRRTAVTLPAPAGLDIRDWPLVVGADEGFYFKPDAGQLLLSPANEDPMPPCDVAPEELDVALAVDRFEAATTHRVTRLNHRWAGLRSFVADRSPVAGFDARAEGFFWLAGQGGYGIQMAPALARTAAALLLGKPLPADVAAWGVVAADIAPARAGIGAVC